MSFDLLHFSIILFLVVALIFAVAPIAISLLIAPRTKGGDYKMPYECGMVPHGRAWGRLGLNYYVYALIFIAFDVDILYLVPFGMYYKLSSGSFAFFELTFFLFFIVLAMLYFTAKGVFEWPKKIKI